MSNLSILTDAINLVDEFEKNNRDEDDDLGVKFVEGQEIQESPEKLIYNETLKKYLSELSMPELLYVATVTFGGQDVVVNQNEPNFEKIYCEMMNAKQSDIINNLSGLIPYRLAEYLRTGIEAFEIEEVRSNTYLLID